MRQHESALVTLEAIRVAARGLEGVTLRTPVVALGDPRQRTAAKAESLQPVGSFKLRGAYTALAATDPRERERGAITYSSGNHGRGVARAARLLGVPAVVVVPEDAPSVKRRAIEADGAEVVTAGRSSDARREVAETIARQRGLVVIPPYDDDRVIAGQGTVGLELVEQVTDLAAVLVPIGGGGLASGVAVAIRSLAPRVRIVGVEPVLAADAQASVRSGHIVRLTAEETARTMADGARTQALAPRTFAHLTALLDDVVTVTEAEIAAGVRIAAEDARLVAEPTGAMTIAAARFRRAEAGLDSLTGTVVAVVSGGNVDPVRYRELLAAPIPAPSGDAIGT